MSESEALENMMRLADYLRDKLSNRKDCKRAFDILNREIMTIRLRVERGV